MSSTTATQHPSASGESPNSGDSPNAEKAAAIAHESPEGVPAHPEVGPRQIGLMVATIVVAMLVVALILSVTLSPMAGVLVGSLALLLFVFNPAVWAGTLRAKERRHIEEGHRAERNAANGLNRRRSE